MSEKIHLRCSKLPLALKCAGSVLGGGMLVDEDSEAARVGRAAHEGLATLIESGRIDWDAVPDLARKYSVQEPELRMLLSQGAKLWEQVKDSFPNARTEVELKADI